MAGRHDAWLERRLSYLIGEQARLKAGPPLRRFLLTADPAHRFHCWATIRTVSAGLDQREHGGVGHEGSGSAPDGPESGRPWVAGLTDQAH